MLHRTEKDLFLTAMVMTCVTVLGALKKVQCVIVRAVCYTPTFSDML